MKKKILLLIGLVFILCGCSSEANLTVTKDGISEDIKITYYENSRVSKSSIKSAFRNYIPVNKENELYWEAPDTQKSGVSYYNRTLNELDNGYIADYSYNYSFNSYKSAKSLDTAFSSYNVIEDKSAGTITLSTARNSFQLFNIYSDLDLFKLKIRSDLEVIEANVEPVNGVYIWEFTPDNKSGNVFIVFKIPDTNNGNSNNKTDITVNDNKLSDKNALIYALIGIGSFIVLYFFITNMGKKR